MGRTKFCVLTAPECPGGPGEPGTPFTPSGPGRPWQKHTASINNLKVGTLRGRPGRLATQATANVRGIRNPMVIVMVTDTSDYSCPVTSASRSIVLNKIIIKKDSWAISGILVSYNGWCHLLHQYCIYVLAVPPW